jgi:hypothetical protein
MGRNLSLALLSAAVVAPVFAAPPSATSFTFALPDIHIPAPELKNPALTIRVPSRSLSGLTPRLNVVFFCGGVFDYEEPRVPVYGLIDLFGSVDDFRVALAADTVEVVELKPSRTGAPAEEYVESAVTLSAIDSAVVRAILTYDASYSWRDGSDSDTQYAFRVKLRKAGRVVTVDLSLSSRTARVVKAGSVVASSSIEFGYEFLAAVIECSLASISRG